MIVIVSWSSCAIESNLVYMRTTVNPEIFARILFLRIALKDILAMLKVRD